MKKGKGAYHSKKVLTSLFMLATLFWLTISTPFVYGQEETKTETSKKACQPAAAEEDNDNPFAGSEEKSEGGAAALSEYLHEQYEHEQLFTVIVRLYKCHPDDLYFQFHPQLISPPPEV